MSSFLQRRLKEEQPIPEPAGSPADDEAVIAAARAPQVPEPEPAARRHSLGQMSKAVQLDTGYTVPGGPADEWAEAWGAAGR